MVSRKKGTKRKAAGAAVTRRISVPAGTKEIIVHITIGRKVKRFKMAKSGIDADPLGGSG